MGIPSPGAHGKPETISFNLRGMVAHIIPELDISIEQPLYEERIINFSIDYEKLQIKTRSPKSPRKDKPENFKIEIFETPPLSDPICADHIFDEDSISKLPKEFHSDLKKISVENLKKGLNLRYLPLQENRRECYVIFTGEFFDFVVRIRARGSLPAPTVLPGWVRKKGVT